ncbi:tetraspanin-33-like isoform X1 [Orbicella faveolata]|uniref:tetraspanin-33-like isoform X1 n=1 Tax=Orbicella faveolata TaxID=48498 RepID=UPI0009E545FF|nr:tetraspanin-33-like isoform X1 [Orbicella faveolata]
MQNKHRRMGPRPSSLEDPSKCIKFSLFFLNVLFWLAAILILGVGVYMMVEKKDAYQNLSDLSFDPAVLFVLLGAALFIITFLGCLGALRENTCMLCFYASIVGFLLLVEVACGFLGFFFRERVQEGIGEKLSNAINLYRDPDKPDLQLLIETTQTEFKCCGIASYEDWGSNIYFNCSSPGVEACGVPRTCCKTEEDRINSQCGYGVGRMDSFEREKRIYTRGCLTTVVDWFKNNLITIGIVSFGILLLQIITIWLATTLRGQVSDIKSTFNRR